MAIAPTTFPLRLLATSDLHGMLLPYDYRRDQPLPAGGLAGLAPVIDHARKDTPNHLLFDVGDLLEGTLLAEDPDVLAAPGHPLVAALNALDFDAATLGNHDFDHGLEPLARAIDTARFPIVCANLHQPDGGYFLAPSVLLRRELAATDGTRRPVLIGVTGILPPETLIWNRHLLEGRLEASDPLGAVREAVADLRRGGADLVIVLAHSGLPEEDGKSGGDGGHIAGEVARIAGVDAVFAGHTHRVFPRPIDFPTPPEPTVPGTTPLINAGAHGQYLAVLDLTLVETKAGLAVTASRAAAWRVPNMVGAPDARVTRVGESAHQTTLARVRRVVGETLTPIDSYFALVRDCAAVQLVNDALIDWGRLVLATSAHAGLPVLAATAVFRAGGYGGPEDYVDIAPGPLRWRDVAALHPHANTVALLRIDGRHLRQWLERSAALYRRVDPGAHRRQKLIDHAVPSFDFDVIDGVEYRIDPSRSARFDTTGSLVDPGGGRITHLAIGGRPVSDGDEFIIATSSHRANGGGSFPGLADTAPILVSADTIQEILAAYLSRGPVAPIPDRNWALDLSACPAVIVFESSPHAIALAAPEAEALEPAADGFLRYRLRGTS